MSRIYSQKAIGTIIIGLFLASCGTPTTSPAEVQSTPTQKQSTPTQATFTPTPLPTVTPTLGPRINFTTSGRITQDEIWRDEIHITGDIWFRDNVTLSIEPGTTVYLASNSDDQMRGDGIDDDYTRGHNDPVRLEEWSRMAISIDGVSGVIHAVGTPEEPIIFRPEGDSTSPAQWDGIIIERGTLQHATVLYGGRTAVQASGGDTGGVEIAYNEVRYFHWAGIGVHTSDVWIHHNIVEGGGHQGVTAQFDALIEHNIVIAAQTGIGVEHAEGVVIRNNIVLDSVVGIDLRDGETAAVLNNTVLQVEGPPDGWYYQGELVYPAWTEDTGGIDCHISGPFSILNNIVYGQFDWGLGLHIPPVAGSRVDHNLIWGTHDLYGGPGHTVAGPNNLRVAPLFVDVVSGDYHLLPDSPAIDHGDPDILDPDGSPSDLGAYGGSEAGAW